MSASAGTPETLRFKIEIDPLFADLAPQYLDSCHSDIRKMRSALVTRDLVTIEELAHRLAGTGGALGFDFASESATEVVQAARQEDEQEIRTALNTFAHYLDHVEFVIR